MDEAVQRALDEGKVIDITTIGRKSGEPRRIEIWYHNLDGRLFITGRPGRRSWYANLVANPAFTFHVKEGAQADIPAEARAITSEAERRELLTGIVSGIDGAGDVEAWVSGAPLVEVTLRDA